MFKAILLEGADGNASVSVANVDPARLPAGDVSVRVECSTINCGDVTFGATGTPPPPRLPAPGTTARTTPVGRHLARQLPAVNGFLRPKMPQQD